MIAPVRLGAVSYLNVRPLVYGLDAFPDRVSLRFDVPTECARLLAAGAIDLGMVPSIAYTDRPGDRIVPGVCIGSEGPVASVALFSAKPLSEIRRIALDTSSRTSAVLLQILCLRSFGIRCAFVPHEPDLASMLAVADAALLIGDAALFVDHSSYGPGTVEKIDLGQAWSEMTGLPFVWAFWAGGPAAVDADLVALLRRSAKAGMANVDAIAARYCADAPQREPVARRYLREHLLFEFGDRAVAGLRLFYREAGQLGLAGPNADLAFF